MPRLQVSRRACLLSTDLRNTFLEAFNRNVLADAALVPGLNPPAELDATRSLGSIARRVQADMRRATGRYFPLNQVIASIHALKSNADLHPRSGSTVCPPAPQPLQILITPTSPDATVDTPSSMSRRRLACNIPALQSRLSIPGRGPPFPSRSPGASSPLDFHALFNISRSSSFSSSDSVQSPVTPLEQIVHTPLTPPKIPRALPPPPRTWAQLNSQMHNDDISPIPSPSLSFTPYILGSSYPGKPVLNRLHIPATCTLGAGDSELRENHLAPSLPSLSPIERVSSPLGEGASAVPTFQRRPTPVRNNSTSNLTRTALLRASSPHLGRSASVSEYKQPNDGPERAVFPISPVSPHMPSSAALASPFIIRSEEMDTEYFRF